MDLVGFKSVLVDLHRFWRRRLGGIWRAVAGCGTGVGPLRTVCTKAGGWRLEAGGWRLEAGGWRLEAGGWRLGAGGWGLEAGWRKTETNNLTRSTLREVGGFVGPCWGHSFGPASF